MPQKQKKPDTTTLKGCTGQHLQNLMELSGKTIPELLMWLAIVEETPITESGIRKWFRGHNYPPPEIMVYLAQFFGLSDYRHILPPPTKIPQKYRSKAHRPQG